MAPEKRNEDAFSSEPAFQESESLLEEEEIMSLSALREAFARLDAENGDNGNDDSAGRRDAFFTAGEKEPPTPGFTVYQEDGEDADQLEEEISGEKADGEPEAWEPTVAEDDPVALSPRSILEAMLFVGDRENRPLTPQRAAELMRNVSADEIAALIDELNNDYRAAEHPYAIILENGGYRLVLRSEHDAIRAKFYGKIREVKLSQQAIDVLAVVAYRQPTTADEVQAIRKAPSSAILTQLVRRGLLGVEQRTEAKKRVLFYRTTDRFLRLFGLDSISDLPTTEDLGFQ